MIIQIGQYYNSEMGTGISVVPCPEGRTTWKHQTELPNIIKDHCEEESNYWLMWYGN